ncbi:MAG: hypothetical protein FJ320_01895 [SAR202 cluster bacterium]|nr:hypothetical protein [SAR202 cluster bacterium]
MKWVWCLRCQRCFEVSLSREPREARGRLESTFVFLSDFEKQFRKGTGSQAAVRCQYDKCDGDMMSFWWWEDYLERHPEAPKTPTSNTVYQLYKTARV